MPRNDAPTNILASQRSADRVLRSLSRRHFLGLAAGAAAGSAFLAACGGGGGSSSGKNLNLYTWAEYDDPDVMKNWGKINIDIFDSNEEAIQKLSSSKGKSGYDVVVPTGAYIPQMAKNNLIQPLDKSKIPNISQLDPQYLNQPWDPGNKYSVPKDWGSTGWMFDNTVVKTPLKTWQDFIDVSMGPASGQVSVLDAAPDLLGIYFWANGIDWNTTDDADLDKAEDFLVNQFAKHIKAFDSYPGVNLVKGDYALSQVWNGDARAGLLTLSDEDAKKYGWGLGAPHTELWMDTWTIVQGAKNVDDAYNFINYILDPTNSAKELEFHGYNTAVKGIEQKMSDAKYKDLIFFTPEQVKTMVPGQVNAAQDRQVDIYNKVKTAAGG
jgi:spermidine/putrescine transport system substrate-binding protein